MAQTVLLTPAPMGCQAVPSQRAMLLNVGPLGVGSVKKFPPATTVPLESRRIAKTCEKMVLPRPAPIADHVPPPAGLHRAMLLAGMPPALSNRPPTITLPSLWGSSA